MTLAMAQIAAVHAGRGRDECCPWTIRVLKGYKKYQSQVTRVMGFDCRLACLPFVFVDVSEREGARDGRLW